MRNLAQITLHPRYGAFAMDFRFTFQLFVLWNRLIIQIFFIGKKYVRCYTFQENLLPLP